MTKKKELPKGLVIPGDVPLYAYDEYSENFLAITRGTGRFFMFAADHKIEHLNNDFYGAGIDPDTNDPTHIFRIAEKGSIGALATQAGLIARYGHHYKGINYIVKLNGKTNLDTKSSDPISDALWDIDDVLSLKDDNAIAIRGIGYTIYLGSEYEHLMLKKAAHAIFHAHQAGLLVVLWVYPRACHIADGQTPELIAGATGIANALGADFVKVHVPHTTEAMSSLQALKIATQAAGNTGVICSGGAQTPVVELLTHIHDQIVSGRTSGCAIGRNIFQRSLPYAVALTHAISALVYDGVPLAQANEMLKTVSET